MPNSIVIALFLCSVQSVFSQSKPIYLWEYDDFLRSMDEMPLSENESDSIIRVIRLPSFSDIELYVLRKVDDSLTLTLKSLDFAEFQESPLETKHRQWVFELDEQKWKEVFELAGDEYFNIGDIYKPGLDGTTWYVEINVPGKYNMVNCWSPDPWDEPLIYNLVHRIAINPKVVPTTYFFHDQYRGPVKKANIKVVGQEYIFRTRRDGYWFSTLPLEFFEDNELTLVVTKEGYEPKQVRLPLRAGWSRVNVELKKLD